ncbi:MAG: hypothetical protein IT372_29950 [Polyangiaceae bacterium]|nr:hypothetical protein [Polyangiaceae bacterium]
MIEDRILRALRTIVREAFPNYDFHGLYRYRVVRMVVGRVDLQAVDKAPGLPNVLPVPVHTGMAGISAQLTPGSMVLVEFVEGDPGQPVITHFSTKDEPGFLPVELALDATDKVRIGETASAVELGAAAGVVVRHGDTIVIKDPVNQNVLLAGLIEVSAGTAQTPAAVSRVKA